MNHGSDEGKLDHVQFEQGYIQGFAGFTNASVFFGSYTINQDGLYTAEANSVSVGSTLTISGNPAVTPVAATPEPSSIALLGTGLLGAVAVMRKRFA